MHEYPEPANRVSSVPLAHCSAPAWSAPTITARPRRCPQQYKELPEAGRRPRRRMRRPRGIGGPSFTIRCSTSSNRMVAVSNQTVRQNYANYLQALAEVKVARAQLFPDARHHGNRRPGSGGPGYDGYRHGDGTASATPAHGAQHAVNSGDARGHGELDARPVGAGAPLDRGECRHRAVRRGDVWPTPRCRSRRLLATTVIELRMADANIDLQQRTVDAYRESLRVTKAQGHGRHHGDPAVGGDHRAGRAGNRRKPRSIGLGVARAQYAHAIAVLVGKNPEDLDIPHSQACADAARRSRSGCPPRCSSAGPTSPRPNAP